MQPFIPKQNQHGSKCEHTSSQHRRKAFLLRRGENAFWNTPITFLMVFGHPKCSRIVPKCCLVPSLAPKSSPNAAFEHLWFILIDFGRIWGGISAPDWGHFWKKNHDFVGFFLLTPFLMECWWISDLILKGFWRSFDQNSDHITKHMNLRIIHEKPLRNQCPDIQK